MCRDKAVKRVPVWVPALVFVFGLTAGTGCDPVTGALLGLPGGFELFPPPEAMEERLILGGTAERVIIARTANPEWAEGLEELEEFDPLRPWEFWEKIEEFEDVEYEPPETEVVAVNLRTLERELLLENIPVEAYALMTDGRWLAWEDYEDEEIRVVDLESGVASSYFPGLANGRILGVNAVSEGYLILEAGLPSHVVTSLVVMDLQTEQQLFITPAFLAGAWSDGQGSLAVIKDDLLVMHVWPPFDEQSGFDNEAPLVSTIDIIDLTTGERSTLVADAGQDGGGLYLADDRILLMSSPWDSPVTVRSFPLDGSTSETLAEFDLAETDTRWSRVAGFNEHGVLISTSEQEMTSPLGFKSHEWLEFHAFDGRTVRIAESVIEAFSFQWPLTGWLVEDFVIYRDPQTLDYVVFDVTAQSERRFDPFGG